MADRSPHRMRARQDQPQISRARDRSMSLPAALHFNQEIARYSKAKQFDLACQSFERMLNAGVPPDVVTYNTMINVYVKSQRLSDAFSLFEEMKAHGIDPTIVTYTSLIDGCGKCNSFGQAMVLYEDVKSSGISLNMHFFNAILNAGLLNGNVYIIDTVMADVQLSNLKPNTVTFNTLLAGFSRFDQLSRMRSVVEHMMKDGVEFSSITQTTLLQAAQLVRDQNDLRMFLDLLDTAKFVPSKNQASQAVMDLINAKRLFIAQHLITAFLGRGSAISEEVFGAMCRLCGEFGNFTVLQWVIETANAYNINVEEDSFIAKISIFCKFGDHQAPKIMYSHWGDNHGRVPFETKIDLVEVLLNGNDNKSALLIIDHMVQDNQLSAQANSAKLFKVLLQREMYSDILRIYDILKEDLITFDVEGADCVIQAVLKTDIDEERIESICDIHPSMSSIVQLSHGLKGQLVQLVQWDKLAKGTRVLPHPGETEELMIFLISNGLKEQAWEVFKHFIGCGLEATSSLISLAYVLQKDKRDHNNLLLIYNSANEAEVPIDSDLGSSVLISAIESGNMGEAWFIYDELVAARVSLTEEAKELHKNSFKTVKFSLQNTPQLEVEKQVRGSRTRRRSSTCPRLHLPTPDEGYFNSPFISDEI